jgi:hypothetical protein
MRATQPKRPDKIHLILERLDDTGVDDLNAWNAMARELKPLLAEGTEPASEANALLQQVVAGLERTGSGGASGLLAMRANGARTLAQDEASCVVFGMPKKDIKLGAADEVVALEDMTHFILQALQAQPKARRAGAGD